MIRDRGTSIVNWFYNGLACVHVEPAQPTPSTAPPLPCQTHPAQRPFITLVGDPQEREPHDYTSRENNQRFLVSEGIDLEIVVFSVFLSICGFWRKKSSASRTKSHAAEEERARQPVGQESAVKRPCRRHHRPRALRIVLVCKEPPVAQAQGLRDQSKSEGRLNLKFGDNPE